MGLYADAIAVAAHELAVIEAPDALEIAEAKPRRPIPLAAYRAGDWCAVFFVIKQTDEYWRTEIVPVRAGEINATGGGTGGLVRRSDVQPGNPVCEGEFRCSAESGMYLVSADGVSADDAVRMRWEDQVVAQARVAAHGYFVLAAVLPDEAEVTIETA